MKIKWKGKTKVCPTCTKRKPATLRFFRPNKTGRKKGCICECRKCECNRAIRWGKKNPGKAKNNRRRWRLRKLYSISPEEYDRLVALQGGCCAICARRPRSTVKKHQTLHVDHDHKTGAIRGLLCFTCNAGLGNMKDDPQLLRAGAAYLERVINAV